MSDWAAVVVAEGVERYNNRPDDVQQSIGGFICEVMQEQCIPISRVKEMAERTRASGKTTSGGSLDDWTMDTILRTLCELLEGVDAEEES